MNLIETLSAEVGTTANKVVLLPVGSLEQHGTEAPLGCDGIIAEALCKKAGLLSSTFVLPALFYGYSHCHTSFPGTFSLSKELYSKLISEIITEAERNQFKQILIISGHGGNRDSAETAISQQSGSIKSIYMGYWQLPGVKQKENELFRNTGFHITTSEVSMVWHILSGKIPGSFNATYPPAGKNMASLSPEQWRVAFPDGGVSADLSDASIEKGKIFFDFIADSLASFLKGME